MCKFCQGRYKEQVLTDEKNGPYNPFSISLFNKKLWLWKKSHYIGCYEVNFCPVCGRDLHEDGRIREQISLLDKEA